MREKKWYIKEIIRIIHLIDNSVALMKIYTVSKTHLAILDKEA